MNNNSPSSVLLIYFNFKGVGQMIRYLLCYLQVPFTDIFLDEYQQQKSTLAPQILLTLKNKSISKADLPAIIHNNEVIYEVNQIIMYLCMAFQREDLLGVNIFQKAQVCEILELHSMKLVANIRFYHAFLDEIYQKNLQGFNLLAFIQHKFPRFLEESGYCRQLTSYLALQPNQMFVLNNLTVVDFYFVQSCKYSLFNFGNIEQSTACGQWVQASRRYRLEKQSKGERVENSEVLRTMKKYFQFFHSQQFYQRSREYLQRYKLFPSSLSKQHLAAMKKLQPSYSLNNQE